MKKLLLLSAFILLLSCNSDDGDNTPECENKVWSMVENCAGTTTSCTYVATYGATQATAGSIITNQSTYQYYTSRGDATDGSQCWEGTK